MNIFFLPVRGERAGAEPTSRKNVSRLKQKQKNNMAFFNHHSPAVGTPGVNQSAASLNGGTTPRGGGGRFAHRDINGGSTLGGLLRHYDDPDRLYDITMPRQAFALGGYQLHDRAAPRGKVGLDAMEAEMRQMRAEQNELAEFEEQQRRLGKALAQRDDLKAQLADKAAEQERRRRQELYDDLRRNERAPYGPARDARREAEKKLKQRDTLKTKLEQQRLEKAARDALEAQHLAAVPDNWDDGLRMLDERIRKAKLGDAGTAIPLSDRQQQQGPKVIQDHRESAVVKKEMEEKPLSNEVAYFADRILLGERARKDNQERYKGNLDEQVRNNFGRRQSEVTANLIIDRSYHQGMLHASQLNSQQKLVEFRERQEIMRRSMSAGASASASTRKQNMNRANDSSSVAATLFGESNNNGGPSSNANRGRAYNFLRPGSSR